MSDLWAASNGATFAVILHCFTVDLNTSPHNQNGGGRASEGIKEKKTFSLPFPFLHYLPPSRVNNVRRRMRKQDKCLSTCPE